MPLLEIGRNQEKRRSRHRRFPWTSSPSIAVRVLGRGATVSVPATSRASAARYSQLRNGKTNDPRYPKTYAENTSLTLKARVPTHFTAPSASHSPLSKRGHPDSTGRHQPDNTPSDESFLVQVNGVSHELKLHA